MVDVGTVTGIGGSVVAIGGLLVTLIKTRADRQLGVSASDREDRRDSVSQRDSLIDQLQEEIKSEREARQRLELRVSQLENALIDEREYTNTLQEYAQGLRHHIFKGAPPPPEPMPLRWGSTGQRMA